jgi:hypothetical protein
MRTSDLRSASLNIAMESNEQVGKIVVTTGQV